MNAIRTLIVDDEPLARDGLRVRLGREDDVDIVGEAEDGPRAVQAIRALRPDVVFLDVQLPGLDGFEVVERVAADHLPIIVFVTAHDRYATRAFDVHALDYLLKPITHRRFLDALVRVRREITRTDADEPAERLRALFDAREAGSRAGSPPAGFMTRFTARDGERFVIVRARDVDWIEAAANYVRLHVAARTFQLRSTIGDLEQRLDPAQFVRVHRSGIVNVDRIREIHPDTHGEYQVLLTTGASLRLSRGYRGRLLKG